MNVKISIPKHDYVVELVELCKTLTYVLRESKEFAYTYQEELAIFELETTIGELKKIRTGMRSL